MLRKIDASLSNCGLVESTDDFKEANSRLKLVIELFIVQLLFKHEDGLREASYSLRIYLALLRSFLLEYDLYWNGEELIRQAPQLHHGELIANFNLLRHLRLNIILV